MLLRARAVDGLTDFNPDGSQDESPMGYWTFDEGVDGQVAAACQLIADSSIHFNDGLPFGNPVYRNDVGPATIPRTGRQNTGSLFFSGNDVVQFQSKFPLHEPGDKTMEFWTKFPPGSGRSMFWTRIGNSDTNRFNILITGGGQVWFDYRAPNGAISIIGGSGVIPFNTWAHVAIVRTGNVYRIYLNGQLATTKTDTLNNLPTASGWEISGRSGLTWTGYIDELRFTDRALDPSEFLHTPPDSAPANLVTNSGFELAEPVSGIPTTGGDWGVDPAAIVTTEQGITPRTGNRMLRFDQTTPTGNGDGADAFVSQIVDLTSLSDEIDAGTVTVRARAFFNRIPGDALTDTEFRLNIRTYSGNPARFLTDIGSFASDNSAVLLSDGDVGTWEELTTDLTLPAGTKFLEVAIAAIEDIQNDPPPSQLDGHFVDDVSLEILE